MSIEASVLAWSKQLHPGTKLVLLALADHADHTGCCWPGAEGLAIKTCMSERTVWRRLAEMEDLGVICRTPRATQSGRRSNLYHIHISDHCDVCDWSRETSVTFSQPDTTDTSNMTICQGALIGKESSIESSDTYTYTKAPPQDLEPVLPEWYAALAEIKEIDPKSRTLPPLEQCQRWLQKHPDISKTRAVEIAHGVLSKWPGDPKRPYTHPWATFQHWAVRPPPEWVTPRRTTDQTVRVNDIDFAAEAMKLAARSNDAEPR
jgi:DNA-binding Lrp family transcriptional regulator